MEQKFFQKFLEEETENFLIKCKNKKLMPLSMDDEEYRKFEDEEVRKAVIRYKIEKSESAKKLKEDEKAKKEEEIAKKRKEAVEYRMRHRTTLFESFCLTLACCFGGAEAEDQVEMYCEVVKDAKWQKKKADEAATSSSPIN